MAAKSKESHKINGVIGYLREYLNLRFDHAIRINAGIRGVRDDLLWHELSNVVQCLSSSRSYGPVKIKVIDILTSFDKHKKFSLFNPSDQHSIFSEIIPEADKEKHKQVMEGQTIQNLGMFYRALNPGLQDLLLLVETWIWWDIPDAVDLCMLDLQAERVAALRSVKMTPELLNYYRNEKNDPHAELTIPDVLKFEIKRTQTVAEDYALRREADRAHHIVMKRDPAPDENFDSLVVQLAQRLKTIEKIEREKRVPDNFIEQYAKVLNLSAGQVSLQRVLNYERDLIASLRQNMSRSLNNEPSLSEPYNFKESQRDLVEAKIQRVREASGLPAHELEDAAVV